MNRAIKDRTAHLLFSLVLLAGLFLTELVRWIFGLGNEITFKASAFFTIGITVIFVFYQIIIFLFYYRITCNKCRNEVLLPKKNKNPVLFCPFKIQNKMHRIEN